MSLLTDLQVPANINRIAVLATSASIGDTFTRTDAGVTMVMDLRDPLRPTFRRTAHALNYGSGTQYPCHLVRSSRVNHPADEHLRAQAGHPTLLTVQPNRSAAMIPWFI